MFNAIFLAIQGFVYQLVFGTVQAIDYAYSLMDGTDMKLININLSLFSETPILTINLYELTSLFFTFFYSVFMIVLVYKVTKKVIKSIFGVLKWW